MRYLPERTFLNFPYIFSSYFHPYCKGRTRKAEPSLALAGLAGVSHSKWMRSHDRQPLGMFEWWEMSMRIHDFLKNTKEKCVTSASEAERSVRPNLNRSEQRSTEP